ncbi:MAG: sigma-70 family RNA polymerase sigma factor [Clostridiales bacterium]|nr:sigma-70 family RNA polymerase sigma factor [Clostridiales bacterium]
MTDQHDNTHINQWMLDYGKLVYSVAFKILKNPQDTEDVFQNTFIKAHFRCRKLQDHKNIKAWLCRVATNEALNKLSSSWKKKVTLCTVPMEIASTQAEGDTILELVKKLPVNYRKCIWLYYYVGYKSQEIAEMTGVSHATIRTRLKRARNILKMDIQDNEWSEKHEYQR